jgi:glycosyltransferase involved in cell wall biosynthesis
MSLAEPTVSVIIPTYRRADVVTRAVLTALGQTLDSIEVIVVVDGRDDPTLRALGQLDDSRLRIAVPEKHLGGSGARNIGAEYAHGCWLAFLDDDDEWLPRKLELQLAAARTSALRWPIVSCRLIERSNAGDRLWPRRLPRSGEPIADYLFCRGSLLGGEGFLQTSTIFGSKDLFRKVPFRDLRINQDLDWVLRASALPEAGVVFAGGGEPLVIWDDRDDRPRVSTETHWHHSLRWIRENRHLVSPRAYASFLLTWLSLQASKGADWDDFVLILDEAFRFGRPSWLSLAVHAAHWVVPHPVRMALSAVLSRRQGGWRGV